MKNILIKHWVLFVSIIVLWCGFTILLVSSLELNNGHFGYPLDDTYIHLSMAKNFIMHGTWGVDRYAFQSATSSPLWTLLISGVYLLFGVNVYCPLIMNIILGTILVSLIYFIFNKLSVPNFIMIISLLSIIFFTPLLPLIFTGMEHVMHALLTVIFVYVSVEVLSKNKINSQSYYFLLVVSLFLTTIRYESLFIIFIVCSLMFLRKNYFYSLLLGAVSIVPIIIYGMISISKGWYFLPNSVLLKGNSPSFSITSLFHFIYKGFDVLIHNLHITVLFVLALYLITYKFKIRKSFWESSIIMLAIFILNTILHILFAGMGWVYRYEAYLMVFGFLTITIVMSEYIQENSFLVFEKKIFRIYVFIILVASIIIFPLAKRGYESLFVTRHATKNIYEQQYQMGLFLKSFYQGKGVAANDIGALNYLADIKCLDLWGLSSIDVAKAKRNKTYSTQKIDLFSKQKDIEIAIIYSWWFNDYGGLPSTWIKVGEWTILDNVICGGETVSFYAVKSTEQKRLIQNLKSFSLKLPKDIVQSYNFHN